MIKWLFCFSFVLYSYTLKCQTKPDFGRESMKFELEVCRLSKNGAVGIRRQRLRGDAWVYKRLVEDILSSCQVWLLIRKPQCFLWDFNHHFKKLFWGCNLWSPSQMYVRNLVGFYSFNHSRCVYAHCTFHFLTKTVNFCYMFSNCNSTEIKFLKLPPSSTAPFFISAIKKKKVIGVDMLRLIYGTIPVIKYMWYRNAFA